MHAGLRLLPQPALGCDHRCALFLLTCLYERGYSRCFLVTSSYSIWYLSLCDWLFDFPAPLSSALLYVLFVTLVLFPHCSHGLLPPFGYCGRGYHKYKAYIPGTLLSTLWILFHGDSNILYFHKQRPMFEFLHIHVNIIFWGFLLPFV